MEELVNKIYSNLNNIFRMYEDREDYAPVDLENINQDFILAELIAFKTQYDLLTGDDIDLIDFIHILNKLAIQYLMDNRKE